MKKLLAVLLFSTIGTLGFDTTLRAQSKEAAPIVGCVDPTVRQQAEHIKQHYIAQGMVTTRDAMINMQSMDAFPVMIQLNKGQRYEIIYVGQPAGTVHKMVLYDGNDKVLKEEELNKKKGALPSNYLIFDFIPERTDTYLVMAMTKLKNKSFCGSISVLASDPAKGPTTLNAYQR